MAVKAENEAMAEGQTVMAMITDEHQLHILEHKAIISDPAIRADAEMVVTVTNHIMEHYQFLPDPSMAALLQLLGQQPIHAPQPTTEPPMVGQAPNGQPGAPMTMADNVQQMAPNLPSLPTNPLTGEKVAPINTAIPQAPSGVA